MLGTKLRISGRVWGIISGALVASLSLGIFVQQAQAIPVFARKYATSCITCHTVFPKLNDVGEAFRRNGYQFPSDEDVLVKEEPVKMGTDAYKDMFPNSIWPSTLPSIPPISIRATFRNIVHTRPDGQEKTWDMEAPHELNLLSAGTFGKDISAWAEVAFAPAEEEVEVERAFVQFSNLFAWEDEEDDDGVHLGNRWLVLPKHALNLRLGRMETSVLPHVASGHARVAAVGYLPNAFKLGQTGFHFEPAQTAVELNGIVKQYWSYAVGIANGGSASEMALDDNTYKDVYFRVSRKWFGYPMDGVIGQPESSGNDTAQASGGGGDQSEYVTPGLDFWRAVGFETGVFGWFGKSNVYLPEDLLPPDVGPDDPNDPASYRKDYFHRIGLDARLQYFDLDLYGVAYWAHDPFPGFFPDGTASGSTDHFAYFVEADYMFKPWILGFLRYEQTRIFNPGWAFQERARVAPGVVFLIRQNLRLSTELYLDTRGNHNRDFPEGTDQIITQLDFSY